MQDIELYYRILGLESPWTVDGVSVDIEGNLVLVEIGYSGSSGACPECGRSCPLHDRAPARRWRHLDTCQLRTEISAAVPRPRCPEHGVRTMSVPWASSRGRFTLLFEALCIRWLLATRNQSGVASRMGVSFDEVHRIMVRAVGRGMARREDLPLGAVGIDEKSLRRGHTYMTVLTDLESGVVVDVAEGRGEASAIALLEPVAARGGAGPRCVCMDMWEPYRTAVGRCLPGSTVVHDRFHVSKHLGDAVDRTRRREQRQLPDDRRRRAKGSRFLFLASFQSMPEERKERFMAALGAARLTAAAWESKELFRTFWELGTVEQGRRFIARWFRDARAKGIPELERVARMVVRHSAGILAYITHRLTNALAENINGRIQQLKSTGRGFRSFRHFRTSILFHYANLDLSPLKTQ